MNGANDRLKILHIDPERGWGGGERQVLGLLEYLCSAGHKCDLLCHPHGALGYKARGIGCDILPIKIRNEFDPRPVFSFRRLIRRKGYDIVHFHTKRAHALSLWLSRTHPAPRAVVTRRMDYPLSRNWYNRYLYNCKTDGVIAISRRIAEILIEAGVPDEKIRVVYSGIDPHVFGAFAFRGWTGRDATVATVAMLVKRKGHRFLLEAAALLKQQGFRLNYLFAGDGPERNELEQQIVRLGLEKEVSLQGFVSDIGSFLSNADIFVLPSLFEGLGVAVLEAMAAGKPIVTSRVGGIPELIQDQETGFLVPPGDFAALAQAISRLVSQESLAERMARSAWERVREEFTLEQMARKNESFYYDLLQSDQD